MSDKKTGMRKGLTRYGDEDFSLYLRKAFIKGMGYTDDALDRPIVGITNTFSEYNACHGTVPQLIDAVKRGVMLAGGLPVEFPTITIHESFAFPTSMYMRNLMAIDTEEMVRAQPMDSVVLIGGCDKTVPALLMGAASAGVPAILEVTGPMLSGTHKGERLGACTDCRRFWGKYRAGEIDAEEIADVTDRLVPSAGTCGVMGTASTMAIVSEALGMMLPGGACIPAVLADRYRHAEQTGTQAVQMAKDGSPTPDKIMTDEAFKNALTVLQAIGGSTNAIVHLSAMAGRLGIKIDLDEFDEIGRNTQVLVDLKPSGENYMDDMHKAGGTGPLLRELSGSLDLSAMTVNGKTLGENIDDLVPGFDQSIIRTKDNPIAASGGMAVLKGNLAPDRAVIKHVAASSELLNHTGKAVVFKNMEDLVNRIDDPDLDVDKDSVLIMQNAGPKGAPGMPESGYLPIPKKLAAAGVKDMVRISDARMSGTAFGTIVLHVAPESAIGGPLALVKDGDMIKLDVENRTLDVLISDEELAERRANWTPPEPHAGSDRGYSKLYQDTVTQAPEGCDFDFLQAREISK